MRSIATRQIMTDKADEGRRAAVRRSQQREADEAQAKADQEAAQQAKAKVLEHNKHQWTSVAFDTIHRGVMASSEAFAREGSAYMIRSKPEVRADNAVTYYIQPSGSLSPVATLAFSMDANGMVRPTTSPRGCGAFPASVRVADVTAAWATEVADIVMIAVLDGQRIPIPD
jgi:Flp pilus assembly protein TadG